MKVYSVRDKMLDYFAPPWMAPTDKEALAAIANAVNSEDSQHAIAKKPEHFEVWEICEINENGEVKPHKAILAECSGLVRRSVRGDGEANARAPEGQIKPDGRTGTPSGDRGRGAT